MTFDPPPDPNGILAKAAASFRAERDARKRNGSSGLEDSWIKEPEWTEPWTGGSENVGMSGAEPLIAEREPWPEDRPIPPKTAKPVTLNDDPGPFQASDLTGEPPKREWAVEEWIPEGVVASLYGDGGVGKSLAAQQLAYAAALGREWFGLKVSRMRALCVMCEDEKDEIHRRHYAIKQSMGYPIGNPFEDVWLWPRVGFDNLLVTFDKTGVPKVSALFERVRKFVLENLIRLLILDTAADLYGGNEIVRAEVNYFLKAVCGRLVREAKENGQKLTVLILAHPSQAGKESGEGFSGNTAWNNGVRARLYLNGVKDGHPDERILTRKKSNYSRQGDGEQINLIWENGVLVPMALSSRTDRDRAKERILDYVRRAWDEGEPYLKRKGNPRNLEIRMMELLRDAGLPAGTIVEAMNELKEAEMIAVKSVNGKYGWGVK